MVLLVDAYLDVGARYAKDSRHDRISPSLGGGSHTVSPLALKGSLVALTATLAGVGVALDGVAQCHRG
jgi:hypothetical protein